MPSSETRPPFDPSTQELVILVHGTFANNSSKSRSDHLHWWQSGGDVWKKIDQQLPEQFHVASDKKKEVFSWSGDNSERDRRAGGRELFRHLQKLEKVGTRYHLIGHSHGGSVIWHCLLESVKQRFRRRRNVSDDKLSLPGLQSYTTIGTPFLQLRSLGLVSRFSPWFWLGVVILSTSVIVGLMTVKRVGDGVLILDDAVKGIASTASQHLAPLLENSLINAGWGVVTALLDHPVASAGSGLLIACIAFFAMVMWAWASAVQLEASVVRLGTRIRNQAFVEFGSRWLGIWSRHDEAINGLRASLNLGGNIAPRIEVSGVTVFDFDRRMRFYRFFARWFVAPAFNLLVSWPSDRLIWKSVSRGIQGNDRPGCLVSDISPGPIVPQNIEWEELPQSYDDRLVEQSNKCLIARSQTLLPQLRDVLSQLAWTRPEQLSLLLANETSFEGNELVHTSYFHEPAILKLIACHIQRHNQVNAPRPDSQNSTTRWCRRFRNKARDLARDPSLKAAALPLLGQRNRRVFPACLFFMALLAAFSWYCLVGNSAVGDFLLGRFGIANAPLATFSFGLAGAGIVSALALSGTRRAKRGAAWPGVARWGWRFARIAIVVHLVAVGISWASPGLFKPAKVNSGVTPVAVFPD